MELSNFPPLNACLNAVASAFLIAGYLQIKRGNRVGHRNCMVGALVSSTLFLSCYLYYHYSMQRLHGKAHTRFIDPEWFKPIYLAILFTHLVGAIAIVPMVLVTVNRAIRERFELHRRIARWTLPVWLYVSVTGVLIYLLLYQVFPQH